MKTGLNPFIPRKHGTVIKCVADLVDSHGGAEAAAIRLGVSPSSVYGYTSETGGADISLAKAVALTDEEHPTLAEFVAHQAGGIFCPIARKEGEPLALTSEAARSNGEAVGAVIESLRDGKITEAEARTALKEVDEAMCDLAALRGLLVAKIGDGR